ncbi:hypothetical protein DSO57_1032830 [Entomophthora muscae]|uniref:Uncharacterized protein n=1 Tax=Entomophthora muscae TaxID=34485 RepID=A0ACC2U9Q7_9FUNG|nr:hypothetical protein DSO57_1032830 [Entomophthora muscae]
MPMPMPMPPPTYTVPTQIIIQNPGSCAGGGNHDFEGEFTCCGIMWAIFCFPCGLFCCCCLRVHRCNKCGLVED